MREGKTAMDTAAVDSHVPLAIREISDAGEFESIHDAWNDLLRASAHPSVFLTHEWLLNWWKCHPSDDRELLILAVYAGNSLIAAAPLMKSTGKLFGLPVKRIEFVSMIPVAASPANCSGVLDFIVANRHDEVLGAMMEHLRNHHRWEYVRFCPVPENSPAAAILERHGRQSGSVLHKKTVFANACIHLASGWDAHTASLSKQFRRTIKQHERKLRELGSVRFVEYRTPFEVEVMYNALLEIEKASWKWGKGVAINSVAFKDFYRRFAVAAAEQGWMRLWMLELNGKNIAYDYCVEFDGKVQSLKKSFREEYRKYFPGGILEAYSFAAMAAAGVSEINLLWGDEDYKSKWSPVMEPHWELLLFNNRPYARFLEKAFFSNDMANISAKAGSIVKRGLRLAGVNSEWSELTREDQVHSGTQEPSDPRPLGPGMMVRVRPVKDILLTLDGTGSLGGIAFLPEQIQFAGRILKVAAPASTVQADTTQRKAVQNAFVLQSACCSGQAHHGCTRACHLLWRPEWLEEVAGADADCDDVGSATAGSAVKDIAECQSGVATGFGSPRFVGLPSLVRCAKDMVRNPGVLAVQKK